MSWDVKEWRRPGAIDVAVGDLIHELLPQRPKGGFINGVRAARESTPAYWLSYPTLNHLLALRATPTATRFGMWWSLAQYVRSTVAKDQAAVSAHFDVSAAASLNLRLVNAWDDFEDAAHIALCLYEFVETNPQGPGSTVIRFGDLDVTFDIENNRPGFAAVSFRESQLLAYPERGERR